MVIGYVWPIMVYPVIQYLADIATECDHPLPLRFVLERRPRLWPMGEIEPFCFGVIVLDIQRVDRPDSEPSMPEQFNQRMGARGILESPEIFQHLFGLT